MGKLNDQVSGILISISFDTFSNSDGAYHHPENPLQNQATRKLDGGRTESFSQKNVLEIWNSPCWSCHFSLGIQCRVVHSSKVNHPRIKRQDLGNPHRNGNNTSWGSLNPYVRATHAKRGTKINKQTWCIRVWHGVINPTVSNKVGNPHKTDR